MKKILLAPIGMVVLGLTSSLYVVFGNDEDYVPTSNEPITEYQYDYGLFENLEEDQTYTCADGILYKWYPEELNEKGLASYEVVGPDERCLTPGH